MAIESRLDEVRRDVLARAERREEHHRMFIFAGAVVEAGCLVAFAFLADFSDRLHILLLLTAFLVYGTLAMGLMALGAYTRSWCLRLLTAIELLDESSRDAKRG